MAKDGKERKHRDREQHDADFEFWLNQLKQYAAANSQRPEIAKPVNDFIALASQEIWREPGQVKEVTQGLKAMAELTKDPTNPAKIQAVEEAAKKFDSAGAKHLATAMIVAAAVIVLAAIAISIATMGVGSIVGVSILVLLAAKVLAVPPLALASSLDGIASRNEDMQTKMAGAKDSIKSDTSAAPRDDASQRRPRW